MELKGEYRIPAPREQVWEMLNDPAVLRECIPGCDSLEGNAEDGFAARVTTKVGPVKATFNGDVTLSNLNPPESYTISGEGKGGVAGFAKGGADVHLADEGGNTVLTYTVNAQVGGKLAQLGSRLIDSTARKLADQFFACFANKAGAGAGAPAAAELPPAAVPPAGVLTGAAAEAEAEAERKGGEHGFEEVVHEVEEEVETRAAMGFLGGPIVWGLLVILALLLIWLIAT
jgi:carbon monoxide dehydrogenase subunit G